MRKLAFLLLCPAFLFAATLDELTESVCKYHPEESYCTPVEPPLPPTGLSWHRIADSSMNTAFVSGIDDNAIYSEVGTWAPWEMIQKAESGAVCANDKLYLTGGGHLDGSHNGILALDPVTMDWERVTEPSPLLLYRQSPLMIGYHDGRREDAGAYGVLCGSGSCNMGPDGNPVAQHTYNLLAWDGADYIYMPGGSQWPNGKIGTPPTAWRFHINDRRWEAIPDALENGTAVTKPNGNAIFVDGLLYLVNGSGHFIFDPESETWTRPSRLAGFSAKTTLTYVPSMDSFVAIGGGIAKITTRQMFGQVWLDLEGAPDYLVNDSGSGSVEKDGSIYYWNTGRRVDVYNPAMDEWVMLEPGGEDPGPKLDNGTFGRFSYCAGEIVLVNGVYQDTFVLTLDDVEPPPPETGMPEIEILSYPYYADRQVYIVDRVCGPMWEWSTLDITSAADVEAFNTTKRQDRERIVLNVHSNDLVYPAIKLKTDLPSCYAVVGVGETKPTIQVVNATHTPSEGALPRQGGVYLENIRVSQYEYAAQNPGENGSGDCLGMPNDQLFYVMRDVDVYGCVHHSLITSGAYGMYMEITDSTFERAYSHNVYIDSVAMLYADNVQSSNPGWGHAFRCIAGTCIIKNSTFSNVSLDGTKTGEYERPDGELLQPIGMAALEVYNCGDNHLVENTNLLFYREKDHSAASQAFNYRTRDHKWGCNLMYHTETEWAKAEYGTVEWFANENWPDRRLTMKDVNITCTSDGTLPVCDGIHPGTSHPIANDLYRSEYQDWARESSFQTMDEMLAALPRAPFTYPVEWYEWTASQVLPVRRDSFAQGSTTGKWPVKPHDSVGLEELAVIYLDNVTTNGNLIRETNDADYFCWSDIQGDDCPNPLMPTARIEVLQ